MPGCFLSVRQVLVPALLLAVSSAHIGAQSDGGSLPAFSSPETLHYGIEWRLITAGKAELRIEPSHKPGPPQWEAKVHLESAGLVSRMYKLDDNYSVLLQNQFCAASSTMDALEGKKHRSTQVTYDSGRGRATYVEHDLLKNGAAQTKETEIPPCVSDVVSGLYKLRTMHVEPGQSVVIPTSDGKKTSQVRIEAQEREVIKTVLGNLQNDSI